MTDPTGATFQGTTNSTCDDASICEAVKELNDLHRIRDLVVKFKPQFPDLRIDLDQWLEHLANSESDFTKGNQNPSLNVLSFAVLVDYEILEKFNDALIKQEHVNEGLQLCHIIVAGYAGFFGLDHQKTLQAQLKLHSYLFIMQEYAQALDLNRQVYKILESSNFGPNHELTMVVQNNVASIFMHQDKCKEATQLLRNVYDRRIYFLGKEHPVTQKTKADIESLLSQIFNGYAAIELLQKLSEVLNTENNTGGALAIFQNIAKELESILGPDHLETLLAKYCVGNAYCALHEFEKAYTINRLVHKKRKKILGRLHVDTLCAHFSLGMALLGLKEYAKALSEFKLLYPLQEAALGPDHEDTWNTLDKTACCLEALKKHEEALDVYEIILQKQQRVLGHLHREPIETELHIAVVLTKLGKCQKALDAFQRVYETQVELFGESHMETAHTKRVLDTGRRQWELLERGETLVCSICLIRMEFLEEEAVILFDCTHVFHRNCAYPWARDGRTCPECRSPLNASAVAVLLSEIFLENEN